jgi:hypothetical protein
MRGFGEGVAFLGLATQLVCIKSGMKEHLSKVCIIVWANAFR